MIGSTLSHYQIEAELGRGGMGIVYKAVDTKLQRPVALKVLQPHLLTSAEQQARFYREARAAAAVRHPNIAVTYAIEEGVASDAPPGSEPRPFIAMEFIEGQTISDLIEEGPLQVADAVKIAIQIADGLDAAHRSGITHRDIKSGNVILDENGHVKILDFGLAMIEGTTKVTQQGATLGTVAYMSPEQTLGHDVDHRTDLWALGVILYEMIAGHNPFRGHYNQAVIYAIMNMHPDRLSKLRDGVPEDLEQVVLNLLVKSADDRISSAEEVGTMLRELDPIAESDLNVSDVGRSIVQMPEPSTTSYATGRPGLPTDDSSIAFRLPVKWLIGGGLTAALAALLWFFLLSPSSDGPSAVGTDGITKVAILPFSVRGSPQFEYLGAGMVDLLSTKLDRAGTWRSVDPRRILSSETVTDNRNLDPSVAAGFVASLGADMFVLGNILEAGSALKVDASLYLVASDSGPLASGTAEGSASDVFSLVDQIAAQLLVGDDTSPSARVTQIASATTGSIEALKAYLDGEDAYRRLDYPSAANAFTRATDIDSTFGLAWYRLAITAEWLIRADLAKYAAEKAVLHSDRLSERDQALLLALRASRTGDIDGAVGRYRDHLRTYPEDTEIWSNLGEVLFHENPFKGIPEDDARDVWEQILEMEPSSVPARIHLARMHLAAGRGDETLKMIEEALDFVPEGDRNPELLMSKALVTGSNSDFEEAFNLVDEIDDGLFSELVWFVSVYGGRQRDIDFFWDRTLVPSRSTPALVLGYTYQAYTKMSRGRFQDALQLLERQSFLHPSTALVQEALAYLLPFIPVDESKLGEIQARLLEWDAASEEDSPVASTFLSANDGLHESIRLQLLGWISLRTGDLEEAERYAGLLDAHVDLASVTYPIAKFLASGLRARIAMSEGRNPDAERLLEQADSKTWFLVKNASPFYSTPHDRFLLAEILHQRGQVDEALRLYSSFELNTPHDLIYYAPGQIRKAAILEESGNREQALIALENAFLLWSDPDPVFQPLFQTALEMRERLTQ